MLAPTNLANAQFNYENECLARIEARIDADLPQDVSRGRDDTYADIEDYPAGVIARIGELVEKYRKAGWNAYCIGTSFHIRLSRPDRTAFCNRDVAEDPPNVIYPVK